MSALKRTSAKREQAKYLQLTPPSYFEKNSLQTTALPLSYALPESSPLRDALTAHVELVVLRLGVLGAFVVLANGDLQHFLAGATGQPSSLGDIPRSNDVNWFGTTESHLSTWRSLWQKTLLTPEPTIPTESRLFEISSLRDNSDLSSLPSVTEPPHLSYYAGMPLTSRNGIDVGVVCVVDNSERKVLSPLENNCLRSAAAKCMDLLDFSIQTILEERRAKVNKQICRFTRADSIRTQILEEPPSFGTIAESCVEPLLEDQTQEARNIAVSHDQDPEEVAAEHNKNITHECDRLDHAERKRDERVLQENGSRETSDASKSANEGRRSKGEKSHEETPYRKVFKKAARQLQEGLTVDGVLFADDVIGYHGAIQPSAETEQELEFEMDQWPSEGEGQPNSPERKSLDPAAETVYQQHGSSDDTATRIYTSPDFKKGLYTGRPAEILGMSTRGPGYNPKMRALSTSTQGVTTVDEGFLQRLMDRHPNGEIWYFNQTATTSYIVKDDRLVENDLKEETERLESCFPGLRQLIFHPLTDPVSLKRLAGCFCWSRQELPVFTDLVDLPILEGFLHIVESEISRIDMATAIKQKESFVSSISHELRTPLHGILGAVQLLSETTLDSLQEVLAKSIKSCGSTLYDTLTSVLSYAKINQFERRQHKYRLRRPPDSKWALTDKQGLLSGPDRDYPGLYVCVNLALLCEEIAGVLEASRIYNKSGGKDEIFVVLDIEYQENWCFFTEPGAIRRIATNIIGNALKYTPRGFVKISLSCTQLLMDEKTVSNDRHAGRTVRFEVTDTGKGMSKDFVQNHLFVPFTQEDSKSTDGVGLGMSIVKSLVSLLSGEIRVKSEVDAGTQIEITMPMKLCKPDQQELPESSVTFERKIDMLRGQHFRIALRGFEDVIRAGLCTYLQDWFHCTILEGTGDTVLDIIIFEESNSEASAWVKKAAQRYGGQVVLLSIVVDAAMLTQRMTEIPGFQQVERAPRPLGPQNLAKALSSCLTKLTKLRVGEEGGAEETGQQEERRNEERTSSPSPIGDEFAQPATPVSRMNDDHRHATPFREEATLAARTKSPPQAKREHQSGESARDTAETRILSVDDNMLNRRLLEVFLTKYGYHNVEQAENGALAVKAVESNPKGFDIIFMDLSMPIMDGFEATRIIRRMEDERKASRPPALTLKPSFIIALTGLGSKEDEEEAFKAGVDVFLTKPLKFDELKRLLERHEKEAQEHHKHSGK